MSTSPRDPRLERVAAASAIAVIAIALYVAALPAPFALDDQRNIVENTAMRMTRVSVDGLLRAAFESPSPRPLANATFALNRTLLGPESSGYRAVNIAIHATNGVLVYLLALVLLRGATSLPGQRAVRPSPGAIALLAALIFVAHPVQTQSVTYVVQRMTTLCATFYLTALLLYLGGRRAEPGGRRAALFAAGLLAWVAALLTKQIAATLPIAVLLIEWFFLRDLDRDWIRRNRARWLLLGTAGVAAATAYLVLIPESLDYSNRPFTLGERLLTQLRVVVFYLSLLLFPAPGRLSLTHHITTSRSLVDPVSTLFAGLLLVALVVVAVRLAPRERLLSFCGLWFFLQLAIESSVFPLEMIFEHRLYLPLVGVSLGVAVLLGRLVAAQRALGPAVAALVVLALCAGTVARNLTWRDPIAFWSDTVAKNPQDARAHNNLGNALTRSGRFEEATVHYRATLAIVPGNARTRSNLAMALEKQGLIDEALREAEAAVRSAPEFGFARYVLGNMHARHGRLPAALPHLSAAVRLDEGNAMARFELAGALIGLGRYEPALEPLEQSVRLNPEFPLAHATLGGLYVKLGRPEPARRHLAEALRLDPRLEAARRVLEELDDGTRG